LFTGAGMNQFKDNFLGRAKLEHPKQRAATAQKCVRAGDIDNVGRTASHHTFFEMLGNFSFGDYFKKEAVQWAAEFLTDADKGLGLEPSRLNVTVFGGEPSLGIPRDEEAIASWKQHAPWLKDEKATAGVEPGWRIYGYGPKDNFWPANAPADGPNGPSGPCSEIYYDMQPGKPPMPVAEDGKRYVEIWNLVFTQFNRQEGGKLVPLPQTNIDTGAGLERMARVIQGVFNNYETDLLRPVVDTVAKLSGKTYVPGDAPEHFENNRRMRRITDHVRMGVFAIGDGAPPKNEGRNYVVRRLLRRAILDGKELGIEDAFMTTVAKAVIQQMKVGYPELTRQQEVTLRVIEEEEKQFNRTLAQGRLHFAEVAEKSKAKKTVSGADAFKLWDTYGFPLELTIEQADAQGLKVDQDGFKKELEEAVKRSQAGSGMAKEIFASGPVEELKREYAGKPTKFVGYDSLWTESAKVLAIIQNNQRVQSAQPGDALVFLDQTTFYGESGGQVGDKGKLIAANGEHAVLDTQKTEGLFLHGVRLSAPLKVGDTVKTYVEDLAHRRPTQQNHSATHLLHYALRRVLGTHVEQRGSMVSPERLRFDFTHFEAIQPDKLREIEKIANFEAQHDFPVVIAQKPIAEAKAMGAMALFGEKYGDVVRVVQMGPSTELCGGTHVKTTGEIGYIRIVSESSISAGVRRIEALTGEAAVADARATDDLVGGIALSLKIRKDTLADRIQQMQAERASLEKELGELKKKLAGAAAGELLSKVKTVAGTQFLATQVEGADANALRDTLDGIRKQFKDGVVVLGGVKDGKVALIVSLTKEVQARGGHAGNILKEIAAKVGGKGGGKPDMAQGGGTNPAGLPEALAAAEALLAGMLK
jgi:alanyl-tRNA synthetase